MAEATPTPKFHFRNLRTSKPLQRVYRLLLDGKERTTRQLNRGVGDCLWLKSSHAHRLFM